MEIAKLVNNRIKIQETNSALKGFAEQYTIDGWEGADVDIFLGMVKPPNAYF